MPRLLLFAPCQKAILDSQDTSVSLIGVVHGFTAIQETGQPVPDDLTLPIDWSVVSIWLRQENEDNRAFEQRIDIHRPDGRNILDPIITPFTMTHRTHQIVLRASGFPVGIEGEHSLALSIRENDTQDWQQVFEYPIRVDHVRREAINQQAQPNPG